MKKATYLLLLTLITVHFFDVLPIGYIMGKNSGIIGTLMLFFWMFWGYKSYKNQTNTCLNNAKNRKPVIWILVGIFLSFVPAGLFYGQSFLTSFIAYREVYIWFFGIIILFICPEPKDIIKGLTIFSILYAVASALRTIFMSDLFYFPFSEVGEKILDTGGEEGELIFGDGLGLLLVPLYYYAEQARKSITPQNLRYLLFFIAILFVIRNRSTLFVAMIIVLYMMMTKKTKYRLLFISIFGLLVMTFFVYTADIWSSLFEETVTQIDDDNYNRVKAFAYFWNEANKSWITVIFGNGFLSSNATSLMADLREVGIVNSDMGLIGFWNQFGIIPIVVFTRCIVKSILNKGIPLYVKATGFHILCGAFTMSYLAKGTMVLLFVFYYYLYIYYSQLLSPINTKDESIVLNPSLS